MKNFNRTERFIKINRTSVINIKTEYEKYKVTYEALLYKLKKKRNI